MDREFSSDGAEMAADASAASAGTPPPSIAASAATDRGRHPYDVAQIGEFSPAAVDAAVSDFDTIDLWRD